MVCPCGGHLKGIGAPGISGSRDTFGISKSFKDDNSGKTIDNWKDWEKARYRDPLDVTKDHTVREQIKEKIQRVKKGVSNGKRKTKFK